MSNFHANDLRDATTPLDPALTGMLDFKTILNASLRTRYKYAEYIIWRPYIFRVLHSPQDPTWNDIEYCRKAFKVRLRCSLVLSPYLTPSVGLCSLATHVCHLPISATTHTSYLRVYSHVRTSLSKMKSRLFGY